MKNSKENKNLQLYLKTWQNINEDNARYNQSRFCFVVLNQINNTNVCNL